MSKEQKLEFIKGHKRLSAVGPIRTQGNKIMSDKAIVTSQTPFGCWSDQDPDAATGVWRKATEASQTPFGCWSDQDARSAERQVPGARR